MTKLTTEERKEKYKKYIKELRQGNEKAKLQHQIFTNLIQITHAEVRIKEAESGNKKIAAELISDIVFSLDQNFRKESPMSDLLMNYLYDCLKKIEKGKDANKAFNLIKKGPKTKWNIHDKILVSYLAYQSVLQDGCNRILKLNEEKELEKEKDEDTIFLIKNKVVWFESDTKKSKLIRTSKMSEINNFFQNSNEYKKTNNNKQDFDKLRNLLDYYPSWQPSIDNSLFITSDFIKKNILIPNLTHSPYKTLRENKKEISIEQLQKWYYDSKDILDLIFDEVLTIEDQNLDQFDRSNEAMWHRTPWFHEVLEKLSTAYITAILTKEIDAKKGNSHNCKRVNKVRYQNQKKCDESKNVHNMKLT